MCQFLLEGKERRWQSLAVLLLCSLHKSGVITGMRQNEGMEDEKGI
jgi:hypothetical protein